ncbi:hypothetical protein AMS62_05020 [Bacillus sp. FJAT-18019]|nr:hypothetical protein AMS62_05020 [Bacillus sp. FJAT-18019]
MKKLVAKTTIMALLIAALVIPGQAMAAETEPPPEIATPFTAFDSNFDYLEYGSAYVSYRGKGKGSIIGETIATRRVDTIGVQLVLQRWTGNEWLDVYTGGKAELSDASRSNMSIDNLSLVSGYYYRVKSTHWITYGSKKEDGVRYSSTLLIPD